MALKRILISNIGLPCKQIGSWTNHYNKFLNEHNDFFDFVLSPTESENSQFLFCKKRNWPKGSRFFENMARQKWVFKDYLETLKKIINKTDMFKLVVIDDIVLLKAIVESGLSKKENVELIFDFWGFRFKAEKSVFDQVSKVFFMGYANYLATIEENHAFSPEVIILPVGVDNDHFFTVPKTIKSELRSKYMISEGDLVISWLANDRPEKGIDIFVKAAEKILEVQNDISVLIIGSKKKINTTNPKIINVGRVAHSDVPKYLQLSDVLFLTTLMKEGGPLALAEAYKCGNYVLVPKRGNMKQLYKDLEGVAFVEYPNIVSDWVNTFFKFQNEIKKYKPEGSKLKDTFPYEGWRDGLLNAL
ncbi:glycosyltransferase family 4 protein [Algoriphagus hitonicola]|uniref:Glycosyl transferases group 1 n=1 Tax=Algoriphagus hitonicola TaxID=435880 RepID=A0A1I2X411_9BACT|nr:glycosyltransferase family 4 protein [Algoriphagus hitonicola]SFH08248.1 Glycosyl transferases group 1 [Algoriphagus hitonicola]